MAFRRPSLPRALWLFPGLGLVVLGGWLDFTAGLEVSLSLLYILPIVAVSWLGAPWMGALVAVASAAACFWARWWPLAPGETSLAPIGSALMELSVFLFVVFTLAALRRSLIQERSQGRTDPLTGLANARAFYELADVEVARARRYKRPLTVAYLDLDNFAAVNTRDGSHAGDALLQVVADTLRAHLRSTDVVARLGSDEFAVLLPETAPGSAEGALARLRGALLAEMKRYDWPVTFSIGASTYLGPPPSPDEMVKKADALMLAAKSEGKNRLRHETLGSPEDAVPPPPH